MNISCLLSLLNDLSGYSDLISCLQAPQLEKHITLPEAVKPYIVAAIYQKLNVPVLVVKSRFENAKKLYYDLQLWCNDPHKVMYYPETDSLTGNIISTDPQAEYEKVRCLSALSRNREHVKPPLVVTSALAAVLKTVPKSNFTSSMRQLSIGETATPLKLIGNWQSMGYTLENIVEIPGTMSRRGGIVDIYPVTSEEPVRIEFNGEKIESIRFFDPKTQRSTASMNTISIELARATNNQPEFDSIMNYLPEDGLIILDDVNEIENEVNNRPQELHKENTGAAVKEKHVSESPQLKEFKAKIREMKRKLILNLWTDSNSYDISDKIFVSVPLPQYIGNIDSLAMGLKQSRSNSDRVILISQQSSRLSELLLERDVITSPMTEIKLIPQSGTVTLIQGNLAEGLAIKDVLTILTDKEIFGFAKQRRVVNRKRPIRHHLAALEFVPGGYFVHIEHGIGKFVGLAQKSDGDLQREYLILEYAAGDKLYVPADQMDRVTRYIGGGDQEPKLTRLGTQEWLQTKQRIKKSVADMAEELLKLYAVRESISGFAFSKDCIWQQELESSFPYVETPDQLITIQAIKEDMENCKPMDRLVCGDVGYGKTEIALRAAFKAVMDDKQVAILVPTTVLAHQHIVTFQERLKAFPLTIAVLSRLSSEKEQNRIKAGLVTGAIDVCIGTHRMLQKDVTFRDLGLLIIDEEQRFGVAHKEYFKKIKQEIDVLTLSATPIPRTLHMALAGIRDLSTMETPPEDRLPIKTYVGYYDERLVREAILKEIERDGQVFFVHNRVNNIAQIACNINSLVPEARISFAHGQMEDNALEEVMTEFVDGQKDVLLTTTIIESGLDIPNVNTLIISDSDRLGLNQLYQLRGRVGRGSASAFAYFLFDRKKQLTIQAKKRLETIAEATDLGAGFAIAMKDLEIRGAGNLLGAEQSGYISAVGFDLYSRLLSEAIEELRRIRRGESVQKIKSQVFASVSLPITYNIPSEFITDDTSRIVYYQRLAAAGDYREVSIIADEMRDRYGILPGEVNNLIFMLHVKYLASDANVESILSKGSHILINFTQPRDFESLRSFVKSKEGIKIGTQQIRLNIKQIGHIWQNTLADILQVV